MTHCTSANVARKLDCNAGSATLTTAPSMNAMLEARIVAAKTQRPQEGCVRSETAVRIAASSHGGLAILVMVSRPPFCNVSYSRLVTEFQPGPFA
jgi:hypothetical protein